MSQTTNNIKNALEKLLNSSFIKDIYPMIDNIVVDGFNVENGTLEYNVFLNTSDIKYKTMYDYGFDPHYLNDYHVKEALSFFSLKLPLRSFNVYKKNGDYLVGYLDKGNNQVYYKEGMDGTKSVDLF